MFGVYHVAFDKQKNLTAFSSGCSAYGPYAWRWGGGFGTTDVRFNEIVVGTLMIDLADAAKQEVVWRGMGVKEIDVRAKPQKRDKNVNKAGAKILKSYPPTTRQSEWARPRTFAAVIDLAPQRPIPSRHGRCTT